VGISRSAMGAEIIFQPTLSTAVVLKKSKKNYGGGNLCITG